MTTKMVKIVDIHSDDGFYKNREHWIGKIGTFEPRHRSIINGFQDGFFFPVGEKVGTLFYSIKVEEISEEDLPLPLSAEEKLPILERALFIEERHGHPDFYKLCEEEMALHSRKNYDYSFGGDPLGNFKRVAKILSYYPSLKLSDPAIVGIVYLLKQLDAVLWLLSNGHEAKVEGQKERWQDVSVYAKIISILIEEQKRRTN